MKTSPLTAADLRGSVLAVPPMPRKMDGSIDPDANRRVLDHLREGRVTTFMYGGNANFYNLGVTELGQVLDLLTPLLATGDWLIPAVGADFGKAAEQIALLRERAFPTAMVLPLRFPSTPAGAASGIGKLAARYGKPVIAYVKDEGYIHNSDLAALVKDGSVCAVKYAIVRHDPRQDPVLADLAQRMGPDLIVSGIGERPVIDHFRGWPARLHLGLDLRGAGPVQPHPRSAARGRLCDRDGDARAVPAAGGSARRLFPDPCAARGRAARGHRADRADRRVPVGDRRPAVAGQARADRAGTDGAQ